MRLLHIVGDSKWGGGGSIILGLVAVARDLGWEVEMLATDPFCRKVFETHGIPVVPLDVIRRNINPVRDLAGLFRLYGFLRSRKYDVVHTHTSKAGFVGRIAARMAGTPTVIHTAHSFSFHEASRRAAFVACRTLETFAALFCDRIITVSHYHRAWAISLRVAEPEKLVAIPNGIPEPVAPSRTARLLRSELHLARDEVLLFTPGRLFRGKGLEYLIEAVAHAQKAGSRPFRVALAGDGPLRDALERRVSSLGLHDRVTLLGFRKDIADLLRASDGVILPSLHEGMSMALLEAMAAGKPIITTAIGGNLEATDNGAGAILVPPGDSRELANAMLDLLNHSSRYDPMARRARALYEQNHTESAMLEAYRREYLALTNIQTFSATASPSCLWHPKE